MSKRVEEAARRIHDRAHLEAKKYSNSHGGSITEEVAYGRGFKAGFIEGYEQAEKDLALTWNDMKQIHHIAEHLKEYLDADIIVPFGANQEAFYTEVLRRFNEMKGVKVE